MFGKVIYSDFPHPLNAFPNLKTNLLLAVDGKILTYCRIGVNCVYKAE